MLPERMLPSRGHPKTTVLIADDSAFMRSLLIRMVESDEELSVIATAANGLEALTKINSLRPDVVTLDIDMPGMGGLELQQQLKSLGFKLPIIVMTLKGDMETAVRAMKGGAVDFIEKPFNDEGLLVAINAALALPLGPARDSESMAAAQRVAGLSPRERQVLDALVAGRSTKQMAYDLGISARTVEVHRARMLARLGTHSLAEAIRLAVLAGLPPADLEANVADRQRRSGASRGLPE